MNDDFLQRLRESPRPEFLAELKAKLDRQPVVVRPRRSSFTRGLITGLLLATAGFAIAAATLGVPDSLRVLVHAPARFLAHVFPGGGVPDQGKSQEHRIVVPLGPAWVPTHPSSTQSGINVETNKAAFEPSSRVVAAPSASIPAAQTSTNSPAPDLNVLTSAVTYPLARMVGNPFGRRLNVTLQPEGIPVDRLCGPGTPLAPEVIEVSRRLPAEVLRTCIRDRHASIIEAKIGYQGVVLARARLYGPMNLSARELFLALARRIPDPNHPDNLIENPYYSWNQINASLPYDPIKIFGPDPTSFPGGLAADLLLEAGCDTFPRLAALRTRDPQAYDDFCRTLRSDGTYITNNLVGSAFVDQLTISPWIVGVFTLPELAGSRQQLSQITLEGATASTANFASGTYPAARTLYVYANKRRVELSRYFGPYVREAMDPASLNGKEPIGYGFVPLDAADRDATLKAVDARKELQY